MGLPSASQSPQPGGLIHLFRFDATKVGGTVHFFTPGANGSAPVVFGGQSYTAIDIEFSDFEVNSGGALPTPKMKIANTDPLGLVQGMINTYGDLVGCEVRRVRTFERFLDGKPEADPTCFIGPDVFRVDRKADENPLFVEWELSAAIDQEGVKLPRRQIIRDTCTRRYRIYDPTNPAAAADGFIYDTHFPCPYTGGALFNISDQATAVPADDRCSRRLTGCEARFGAGNPLPTGAFPGAARVRSS